MPFTRHYRGPEASAGRTSFWGPIKNMQKSDFFSKIRKIKILEISSFLLFYKPVPRVGPNTLSVYKLYIPAQIGYSKYLTFIINTYLSFILICFNFSFVAS